MILSCFTVTRWSCEGDPYGKAQDVSVVAKSFREALEQSGLKVPRAVFTVTLPTKSMVRYQVYADGRARELARYDAFPNTALKGGRTA